uniref:Amino acid transporter transmembrane domain-containing protein n=1 Tax=Acrobeloides nanus TaxID=290746 RepID=A0A914E6C8_9BILA
MGNILMIMSFIFILQYLIRCSHSLNDLPWIADFSGVTSAFGSIIYAFEGQAMVLPLENKLKHPEDMVGPVGVLSTGMSLVTIAYAAISFYGYNTFGNDVKGSIALNLPNQPEFILVGAMLLLIVYMGFALQAYVIVDMLWPSIQKKLIKSHISSRYHVLFEYLFRVALVTLAILIAISIPNLSLIISLVGVTSGMLLAFVLPATFDIITFMPMYLEDNKVPRSKPTFLLMSPNFMIPEILPSEIFMLNYVYFSMAEKREFAPYEDYFTEFFQLFRLQFFALLIMFV